MEEKMNCPHCDTPIDEHETSRCLDAWVAEVIMGWLEVKMGRDDYGGQPMPEDRNEFGELLIWRPVLDYSTDIAAAWEVLEGETSKFLHVRGLSSRGGDDYCLVRDYPNQNLYELIYMTPGGLEAGPVAPTAPLAICRAAMKATIKEFA